jgi:hypothetical protein
MRLWLLVLAACQQSAPAPAPPPPPIVVARDAAIPDAGSSSLVGTWHVTGCDTSPGDPADCARGAIVFTADHWSVELPCCHKASAYTVVSSSADRIKISSDGRETEIRIAADGTASWAPGLGGRVGELSFARAK